MRTISMNSVPFGREECFFRALIIKRRASGTGAANRCAKKLQGLRDARTMRERLHDLRRLGGRTAHTVRKPVAHARWDRVGFVGKARAIRVGNRGTPRGKRVGTALDSHQIREEFPLDPRQQNVRWRRYNGRAARANETTNRRSLWRGSPCQKSAPFTASESQSIARRTLRTTRRTSMLPTEASRRYTRRKESCLRASFLLDKRSSLLHGLLCTSPSLTTIGTLQARTEPVFALTR